MTAQQATKDICKSQRERSTNPTVHKSMAIKLKIRFLQRIAITFSQARFIKEIKISLQLKWESSVNPSLFNKLNIKLKFLQSVPPPRPSLDHTHTLLGRTGCNRQIPEVAIVKYRHLYSNRICLPHLPLSTIKKPGSA